VLKLRRRRAESAASELREINEREVSEVSEAAQEREEAAKKAREDEETVKQMREAQADFDKDCDPDINDEGKHNYFDPGDREIMELQVSDEEERHHSEVRSSATEFYVVSDVHSWSFNVSIFNVSYGVSDCNLSYGVSSFNVSSFNVKF
jgi:hypothetical protein